MQLVQFMVKNSFLFNKMQFPGFPILKNVKTYLEIKKRARKVKKEKKEVKYAEKYFEIWDYGHI